MLNIILLGLTSLLADFSSEMIMPILPFFIQSMGGGGIALGLIFGIGDAVAAIPAGLIAGFLWNLSALYTFSYGFALSLAAALWLMAAIKER